MPTLKFNVGGADFTAEVDYTPGTPDVSHLPNGDPGHPGTPEEINIESVVWHLPAIGDEPPRSIDVTTLLDDLGVLEDESGSFFVELGAALLQYLNNERAGAEADAAEAADPSNWRVE